MERLGFKGPHLKETRDKISNTLKGKHPVGFKKKVECPNCKENMSCPNLPRHLALCLLFKKYGYLFPTAKTLRQFKHAKVCLKLKYGLTLEKYLEMFEDQKGCCKICDVPQDAKRLFVDHCHSSNTIRGLVCYHCNTLLGMCKDDIRILKKAIIYLERMKS